MGSRGGGEQIVARVQDVGLGLLIVVAGQVLSGHGDGHVGGAARFDLGLARVQEHDGGFFHQVFPVIIGVGLLHVQLSQEVAVLVAVVLDLHHGGDVAVFGQVHVHALDGLGVVQVGQAMAEGIEHFRAVVPDVALGRARGGGCLVIGVHDGVEVAGFKVLVAHVDAFGFDDVVAAVVGGGAAEGAGLRVLDGFAGEAGVFAVAVHDFIVGVVAAAEVDHGGVSGVVGHVSVGQRAGGVHFAQQHLGGAGQLIVVDDADVGDAVHFVVAALGDVLEHHGVAGVDQHQHLGAGFLRRVHHGQFVVGQGQGVLAGGFARVVHGGAGSVGVTFAGAAGEYHDGDGIGLDGILPVSGRALFLEQGWRHFHDLVLGHVAGGSDVDVVVAHGFLQLAGLSIRSGLSQDLRIHHCI